MSEAVEDKHTKFYFVGSAGIILGISIGFIDAIFYFISPCRVFDVVPPTTVCFTIASLFFVLDNLKLQRLAIQQQSLAIDLQKKELRNQVMETHATNLHFDAQNKVLINQQYQTTFFSLLNGHTTLMNSLNFYQFMGFEGWSNFFRDSVNEINEYNQMIRNKYFSDYKITERNPFYTLDKNRHSIESTIGDIITIIKLIDEKLPDILYYDILYNYLTVYEKLFIGLYCDCYDNEYTKFIKEHKSYDFLNYYKTQSAKYHLSTQNYFPTIKIKRESPLREFRFEQVTDSNKIFDFYLWKHLDLYRSALILETIEVHINLKDIYTQAITPKYTEAIDANAVTIGNWPNSNYYQMSKLVLRELSKLPDGWYSIMFNFIFKYQSIQYVVCHKLESSILTGGPLYDEFRKFQINYEEA